MDEVVGNVDSMDDDVNRSTYRTLGQPDSYREPRFAARSPAILDQIVIVHMYIVTCACTARIHRRMTNHHLHVPYYVLRSNSYLLGGMSRE